MNPNTHCLIYKYSVKRLEVVGLSIYIIGVVIKKVLTILSNVTQWCFIETFRRSNCLPTL